MAQSILTVRTFPGICHLVAPGGGNLSENLCPAVRVCQILLEAVNVVPFLIFYLKICLFWIALDNSIKNFLILSYKWFKKICVVFVLSLAFPTVFFASI